MADDPSSSIGTYDYVIVGAGSAGCVLANRLSADPATRVLLVEAGGKDDYVWIHVPLGLAYLLGNPRVDWCYESEPEPHLGGRVIPVPRGRVLGGSSSINGMVYVRGHASDYDRWRQLGNPGWAWDDVLPYFKRSEDYDRGAGPAHGAGGELRVGDPGVRWEILDAYRQAAIEAGIPPTADYNAGDNEGVGYFAATIKNGRRWSAARAFLKPALARPNLALATGATVRRIRFEGRRAVGIEFTAPGGAIVAAEARAEVILAAGAIASPALLQRSGIGPGALLQGFQIPLLHELPGVGENLQDHWQIRVQHRVRNTVTLNAWVQNPARKLAMGLRYLMFRSGPMSGQPPLLTAFARTDPALAAPDLQIHVSAASYDKVGGPQHPFPGITSAVCLLRPTSTGRVQIKGADPGSAPAILHNYLATAHDRAGACNAVRLVRRIAASPALARFAPEEISPGPEAASEEALLAHARNVLTTTFHPVGTCMMGNGPMAVVDAELRVRGLGGLRVVDASIMPLIPSGNTNAPTIMIAEKAAEMIRAGARAGAAP